MNLLNKLTIKNLKLNKKRTIVTIVGIILSVALITAVSTMYTSALSSLIDFETYEKGNFHVAFYNVPVTEIDTFKNNRCIENIFITKDLGYAKLENSQNEYKPYALIKGFTTSALENLSVKLVEGRLPKSKNEIIIPTHLKNNGRITLNIGDTITLDIGSRVSEGQTLNQFNPYNEDNHEQIINTTTRTYKIVGIIERPATNIENYEAPGYTFISYLDGNNLSGNIDIYTRYTKKGTKNNLKVTANLLGIDEQIYTKFYSSEIIPKEDLDKFNQEMSKAKYQINENGYLIELETNPLGNNAVGGLGVVVIIVCLIIVFTSVFCIKNSFDISITEKIKQYGMLRSIGAIKRQIKKNVFYEASILGIIGIPLGIFLGLIASYILIIISNYFMKDMLNGLSLKFATSWIAILFAIILGIISIYLSALKSANRAAKTNPIDSIRNSAEINIKSKKIKSPKIIDRLFGIGGDISYKNLKRNKKKYRTTVISIVVSVSVFIALTYFMNLAFLVIKEEFKTSKYNLSLSMHTNQDEQIFDKLLSITKLDNIEQYSIIRQSGFYFSNPKYSNEYKKLTSLSETDDEGYINIYAVGEEEYKRFLKELGLNYEEVKNKGILIDYQKISIYDNKKNKSIYQTVREFSYNTKDKIIGYIDDGINPRKDIELEICFITDKYPLWLEYISNSMIIISDELYDSIKKTYNYIEVYYKSNNADKLQDDIDEVLNGYDYYLNNIAENVRMMKNFYTLIGIFLYGFIIVISLIGITNIFNTITTNMELRRQEFAMLKSVGMTTKEFNRMIRLESIFMGTKSLLFGIPIGISLAYLIYHFLGSEEGISFNFPIIAIIISILAVFLLITFIMKYSINKINKQNTIETIKNENI